MKFDLSGDGIVDPLEEIMTAYDVNGDATFCPAEVHKLIEEHQTIKSRVKNLSRIVFGLIFVLVMLCGIVFLAVLGGNEASKEN